MRDSRCFIQCSHPGREHVPDGDGGKSWNKRNRSQRRKFMQFRGEWVEPEGERRTGDLAAWGEWEPESDLIRELQQPDGDAQYPRYLWRPYYILKADYLGLHNTDPFIFGERFLYSNCGQGSKPGLKHLGDGSVIAFGSGRIIDGVRRWTLDTVLVVKDSVDYPAPELVAALDQGLPEAFLVATGGLLTASGRLYRGATPDDPVDGMFSFFPAITAGGDTGFPRPCIDLEAGYFNPRSWQAPKGVVLHRSTGELRGIWESLVSQVRARDLVVGTHASLPESRMRAAVATE